MIMPCARWLVPERYPLYGGVPLDRPVFDYNIVNDDLLGLLPPPPNQEFDVFGPTVWDEIAYKKSFEKFEYAEYSDFLNVYIECVAFADSRFLEHFNFLSESGFTHIFGTDKNMESTPAYPKMRWWLTEEDYLDEHGWEYYEKEFDNIASGQNFDVCWYLFLKKEILKQSKIDEGDIRQIVCADPIYSRIGACFEQHQNRMMKDYTEKSSGQCGWSPFFGGFEQRMDRLEKKGNKFYVELDWTRFDGTIPPTLLMHIKKLRFSLMGEVAHKYERVYKWYCRNLVNRFVILPSGEVTLQNRGNPSGQISTTMDNNMINYWLQAFEFKYLGLPEDEWIHFDTIVYGDDRLSTYRTLPADYTSKVVSMYKDVFGMWVKPEKVKVSDTLIGLSFCGFTNTKKGPAPSEPYKLMASLLKPVSKLPDIVALHGKLLCFQLLMANNADHPFYGYVEQCLHYTHRALSDANLPRRFTRRQLEYIWRGGPNGDYG